MTRLTFSPARRKGLLATAIAVVFALLSVGSPAMAEEVGTTSGTISGTVLTSDGQPIEGAYVYIGGPAISGAITDANGYYEVSYLELGTYNLGTSWSGYAQPLGQQATLTEAAPTASVNFVLTPYAIGVGSIAVHVTADGVPLANQSVTASQHATGQNVFGNTDENGYYEFTGLANGEWSVYGWAGPQYQFLPPVVATLSDGVNAITLSLAYISYPVGGASISGTVVDVQTGEPIAGAYVSASSNDAPHNGSVVSDEYGAFSFDLLPAGSYRLSVWQVGYLHKPLEFELAGDEQKLVDIELIPTNSSISGRVVDENGSPVEGMFIEANAFFFGSIRGATTDANGEYTIPSLGAIDYRLNTGWGAYEPQERNVTAVANGDVTANFTLVKRTTGSLSGMVFGPDGEYYTSPICATLYSAKNKKPLAHTATYGEEYGDGTFLFFDLEPGQYTVELRDCDDDPATKFDKVFLGGVKDFKDATIVTVVAAEDNWGNDVTLTVRGN